MAILIADSGSTKTDWYVGEAGRRVGRVLTQGINPFHQEADDIERIIVDELLVNLTVDRIDGVYFYGSGCREEVCGRMSGLLRGLFPQARTVEVASDLLGAARAVCGHQEGIACILGTGSNSCLYDGSRIVENVPPLGYILGDEGSGAVLGRLFLNALYKGGLSESLRIEFENELSMKLPDIIRRIYRDSLPNRFLASLSPFIKKHAGDDAVHRLIVGNFRMFLNRNVKAYRHKDLPIGFVGSIASHYRAELLEAARKEDCVVGEILASPIESLASFHV